MPPYYAALAGTSTALFQTADIAIRAALTGHLVFSTLHTNDAPSAITRLTDMGVENYLITSPLVSVLAQRLVRLICPHCKVAAGTRMSPEGETFDCFRGAGCESCAGTGYTSRVGIFELMEMNEEIRQLIMSNGDASQITSAARRISATFLLPGRCQTNARSKGDITAAVTNRYR